MADIDISREMIERLKTMGCADYIHIALLDKIDALAKERDEWQSDSAAAWDKCEERRLAQEKAEAEVERLRKALRDIYNSGQTDEPDHWRFRVLARDTARAALQRKEGNE